MSSFPPPRDFYFDVDTAVENCESPSLYKPGGLHPVLLGEVLPKSETCVSEPSRQPRYRIVRKAGNGAWATVWFAWDRETERAVAIKICMGRKKPKFGREARIVKHLQTSDGGGRHEAIIELLDVFTIKGPNGFHDCLVTEIVGPLGNVRGQLGAMPSEFGPLCTSRDHLAQIASAFAHMHQQGIAHGDPSPGNFGMSLPEAFTRFTSEKKVHDFLDTPELVPVVPVDADRPLDSLPPYLVHGTDQLSDLVSKSPPALPRTVKVFDFGRAFWTNKEPKKGKKALRGCAPLPYNPPEVLLQLYGLGKRKTIWSQAADVWSLGLVLFELRLGFCPTSGYQVSANEVFCHSLSLGGPPPDEWVDIWSSGEKAGHCGEFIAPKDRDKVWERYLDRPTKLTGTDGFHWLFLEMVKSMLVTEPEKRCTMEDVVRHSFFTEPGIVPRQDQ